jgi:hypothetical protein
MSLSYLFLSLIIVLIHETMFWVVLVSVSCAWMRYEYITFYSNTLVRSVLVSLHRHGYNILHFNFEDNRTDYRALIQCRSLEKTVWSHIFRLYTKFMKSQIALPTCIMMEWLDHCRWHNTLLDYAFNLILTQKMAVYSQRRHSQLVKH